ncbi:MAG TPA: DUF2378 family protein [Candidatus Paceibacterota bacterium]|nr:DUF2378 family protein [Candidatus Paceibacterota bacterium]
MAKTEEPTIKGVFVMSHVHALKKAKGKTAVAELERRYGHAISFGATQNVPIREEVKIIELTLDILTGDTTPKEKRAYEAGKLHFNNFTQTPLGMMLFPLFTSNFKMLLMKSPTIAQQVFRGVTFKSEDLDRNCVRITMENNDYPLGHFQGFFYAWLTYSDLFGDVDAKEQGRNCYIYTISWSA